MASERGRFFYVLAKSDESDKKNGDKNVFKN